MSIIGGFLNQEVTVTPKAATAYDKWGVPIAGTSVKYDARVQEVHDRVQTSPETYVDISLEVWLPASSVVDNDDTVTWDSEGHSVVKVQKLYYIDGTQIYTKVFCR